MLVGTLPLISVGMVGSVCGRNEGQHLTSRDKGTVTSRASEWFLNIAVQLSYQYQSYTVSFLRYFSVI